MLSHFAFFYHASVQQPLYFRSCTGDMTGAGFCVTSKICQAARLQSFSPVQALVFTINKEHLVVQLFTFVADLLQHEPCWGNYHFSVSKVQKIWCSNFYLYLISNSAYFLLQNPHSCVNCSSKNPRSRKSKVFQTTLQNKWMTNDIFQPRNIYYLLLWVQTLFAAIIFIHLYHYLTFAFLLHFQFFTVNHFWHILVLEFLGMCMSVVHPGEIIHCSRKTNWWIIAEIRGKQHYRVVRIVYILVHTSI